MIPAPMAIPARPMGIGLYAAEIPPPPSVNALFYNRRAARPGQRGRGKTAAYRAWIAEAGAMLIAQGRRPECSGPVAVMIDIGDGLSRIDTDNAAKAVLDLLVRHRIILDDKPRTVRHVSVTWSPARRGCYVHVYRWVE